jgi:ribonuclease P protein component
MYPTVIRLQHRPQFLKVAATRRKWVTPGLILQARCRSENEAGDVLSDAVRIGFTVSKKVGNAVKRNKARRRLRAAAQEVLAEFARSGYDYVVIGRAVTVRRPYLELVNDLRTALQRLKA